jgi:hypothetical protein
MDVSSDVISVPDINLFSEMSSAIFGSSPADEAKKRLPGAAKRLLSSQILFDFFLPLTCGPFHDGPEIESFAPPLTFRVLIGIIQRLKAPCADSPLRKQTSCQGQLVCPCMLPESAE